MLTSMMPGAVSQWEAAPDVLPALSLQPKGSYTLRGLEPNNTYYVRGHIGLPSTGSDALEWKPIMSADGVPFATLTSEAVQQRTAAAAAKVEASKARALERQVHSAEKRRSSATAQARAQSITARADAVATQSVHALQEARTLCKPGSIAARQARLIGGSAASKPAPAAASGGSDAQVYLQEMEQLKEQLAQAQAALGSVQAKLNHSSAQPAAMEAKLQQMAAQERELRIQLDDFSTPGPWSALEQELRAEGFQRGDVRLVLSLFESQDAAFKRQLLSRIDDLVTQSGMPRMYVREAAAVYELRVNGGQDVSVRAVLQGQEGDDVPAALQGATASIDAGDAGDGTDTVLAFIRAWVQVHYPEAGK